MKKIGENIRLSASDLSNHLSCGHLTQLDLKVCNGSLEQPDWQDPSLVVLQQRGLEHEAEYIQHLREKGLGVEDFSDVEGDSVQRTKDAMAAGVDVIVQAAFEDGNWIGRADVLLKIEKPSSLGDWSYEVADTKLSKETKGGAVLQLCLYSDLLGKVQNLMPEKMYIVAPGNNFIPSEYRTSDYFAYYRLVKSRLEATTTSGEEETYPDPVNHCEVCRWWSVCDGKRRNDDHLSLVAGMSKLQTRELQSHGIETVEQLSQHPIPFQEDFTRGASEGYVRVREQARVQVEGRSTGEPVHELLELEEGRGLALLPTPSDKDIFFDIEGDAFVGESGLEYLMGFTEILNGEKNYNHRWATTFDEEKAVFEWFVDSVMERWNQDPNMHIYHFAPYEPSSIKRLMGRYATRESEVDQMLRANLFIDLHAVVKQSLRASVERYSIKDLEQFYEFTREVELRDAARERRVLEHLLELNRVSDLTEDTKDVVLRYNRDDCNSTVALRDWLEGIREEVISQGNTINRPEIITGEANENVTEEEQRVNALKERLTAGIPVAPEDRTPEQQATWILAELLSWHRRELKAPYWELFRLCELGFEELLEERSGISGLQFHSQNGGTAKCPIHRYTFSLQEADFREGETVYMMGGNPVGSVSSFSIANRTIEIKKRGDCATVHPSAIFRNNIVNSKVLSDALFRIGEWVANNSINANGSYRAARDLLLQLPPRLPDGTPLNQDEEDTLETGKRVISVIDNSILPIQGPPGAGKTHTGSRMIAKLLSEGKKVGVTAVSHKVIRNLLSGVVRAMEEMNVTGSVVQKVSKVSGDEDGVREVTKNPDALTALSAGGGVVVGGTGWLWASEPFTEAIDVLFVDEAGQMSLANVIAVSQSAGSVVMLGDPQQLEQPSQASHPDGTGVSALEHILGEHQTIPEDRGLFLGVTWRLHPEICSFTSELFYEGRLHPREGLEAQVLSGGSNFSGPALWYLPIAHEGNKNSSPEEVERVVEIVNNLIQTGSMWTNSSGETNQITLEDILVVAPYNAQVTRILERLPDARVGTVDKFQGQEAPVVIYSMTTSSPEDAPRGMEFLYSLNRLNVATSRAQCTCIILGNPKLFEPDCNSPRQMQLANAFCRYLELATSR